VPFGTLLGSSRGVEGFSNANNSVITDQNNFIDGVFMGMKWQCVEYARRYLFLTRGMTFDSVAGATNIWDLPSVTLLSSNEKYALVQHSNGVATSTPQEGDLMIWPIQGTDTPFGHVAVVVGIEYNTQGFKVRVAEQNFLNEMWEVSDSYARTLTGDSVGGKYTVTDLGYQITGWLSVGHLLQGSEPPKTPRGWDTTMLGLLAIPIVITGMGIAVLAYKRRKEASPGGRRDGDLLLDEDQVVSQLPMQPRDSSGEMELELENIR